MLATWLRLWVCALASYISLTSASLRLPHRCCVSSLHPESPSKDLLGPFLYPIGALWVWFDNRSISSQVSSGVHALTVIRSTISDRIIQTLPALLTRRAALVKCQWIHVQGSYDGYRKVRVLCYAHLLNGFRVSKGHTRVQYIIYCIASSAFSWVTCTHGKWTVLIKSLEPETGPQ